MLAELTPLQRWDAITRHHSSAVGNRWFIIIGLTIVALLTMMLLISVYRRKKNAQRSSGRLFDEYARAKDLTDREYRILSTIAVNSGMRRNESIFTLPSAFDREAAKMLENTRNEKGTEESEQLQIEISLLREKLDFHLGVSPASVSEKKNDRSTRQIPVKKKFYIKPNSPSMNGNLEAVIIENTPAGLTVQFKRPVEIVFGKVWTCRYYSGAFVAEFNTTVVKCSGNNVVLNHSDHVRLINRRRFLRVPVQKPAYVASFPFKKEPSENHPFPRKKSDRIQTTIPQTEIHFKPPRFVPATVTELGGPGLRINTELNLNVGDRVLLMFKLDQNKRPSSSSPQKINTEKIIEHIADVKHVIKDKNVPSVALELTGLNDSGIDELIRATNEASIEINRLQNSGSKSNASSGRVVQLQPV